MSSKGRTPTVLIVDDEPSIVKLVEYAFQRSGFATESTDDGEIAYDRVREHPDRFDMVILDVMLPGTDGMDLCRRLRQQHVRTPIILLTARDDEVDRVIGLEIGADDYVTKPFSPRELVARAKAVLRRTESSAELAAAKTEHAQYAIGEIAMDLVRHETTVRGQAVELTPKEFELLQYLLENAGRVLTRDQLLDQVWGYTSYRDTRIVDVHVSHLREKIESDPKHPEWIRTVRGVGYKFSGPKGY